MTFRFRLETLFKLRSSQEQAERMALARIGQKLAEVKRHLADIQRQREVSRHALAQELQTGLVAKEIHFQLAFRQGEESRREWLEAERDRLEVEYAGQLQAFDLLRQKRETLEKLRDDARVSYARDWDRRQQQATDEWFLNNPRSRS